MRAPRRFLVAASVLVALSACSSSSTGGTASTVAPPGGTAPGSGTTARPSTTGGTTPGTTPGGGVYVYWDQNEEEDMLTAPDGAPQLMVMPWDPNGQLCILPDNSGRFVTGYNPTNPDQHNPGGTKELKDPPVGEALWNADGTFSGQTLFVPGPYANPGKTLGGDIPPDEKDKGHFNSNGTMTGCAFDKKGNLFASDIGTSQGDFPPPDSGRVIMWFPPDYKDACVVIGPTAGGAEPHHVGGTGGLRNPGTMAADDDGNIYVPEAGAFTADGKPGGSRVFRIPPSAVPASKEQCKDNVLSPPIQPQPFIDAAANNQGFALGIARDRACRCWAVTSVIGGTAVAFYDDQGKPLASRPGVPGSKDYNPFGIAVAPNGDVWFIDIHVAQDASGGFGPAPNQGALYRVTFTNGTPNPPEKVAGGYDFPVSVTVCDGAHQVCPRPTGPPVAAGSITLEQGSSSATTPGSAVVKG